MITIGFSWKNCQSLVKECVLNLETSKFNSREMLNKDSYRDPPPTVLSLFVYVPTFPEIVPLSHTWNEAVDPIFIPQWNAKHKTITLTLGILIEILAVRSALLLSSCCINKKKKVVHCWSLSTRKSSYKFLLFLEVGFAKFLKSLQKNALYLVGTVLRTIDCKHCVVISVRILLNVYHSF